MTLRFRTALCLVALAVAACGGAEQKPPTVGEVKDFATVCDKAHEGQRVALVGYLRFPEKFSGDRSVMLRVYQAADFAGQPVGVQTMIGRQPNQAESSPRQFTDRLAGSGWPGLALAMLLALPPAAFAAPRGATPAQFVEVIVVNTTGDGDNVDVSGGCDADAATPGQQCTLRAAIQRANGPAGSGDPTVDARITFDLPAADPNCDGATGRCTINLSKALPDIADSVEIEGPGSDKLTVQRQAASAGHVFSVSGTVTVFIARLTVSGGAPGITNSGTMSVTDCVISNNNLSGIRNTGTMTVKRGTISDNDGLDRGGGILNFGTLDVIDSTLSGNEVVSVSTPSLNLSNGGGGIYSQFGALNVTNSTLFGNTATGFGTQARGEGGGVATFTPVDVKNTIIANNTASTSSPDVGGTLTSHGYNLIENAAGSTITPAQPTDIFGVDPMLDPAGLKDNGGPTQSVALLPGSPAADKGTANGLTGALATDQRGTGFPRAFDDPFVAPAAGGDNADIGAFERQSAAPTPSPTPTPIPTPTLAVPTFRFDSAAYSVEEGVASVAVRVLRAGPSAPSVAVDVTSEDGTARQKGDYTLVVGRLLFAPGETERSFEVLVNEDAYAEGAEFATLLLQHPSGGSALGTPNTATLAITDDATEPTSNPIDNARTFVGTHYHDLLYRQADQSGEEFWTQAVESCGASAGCLTGRRADVSAAFFLSIEFQQTGYLVIRAHKAAFVLMQYFGYLRRNPDDAPDLNFDGYDFWLGKLDRFSLPGEDVRNESVALGRVRRAEMVRAFIESAEYRKRFFGAEGGNQPEPSVSLSAEPWRRPEAVIEAAGRGFQCRD
jgi:hypothetical protein